MLYRYLFVSIAALSLSAIFAGYSSQPVFSSPAGEIVRQYQQDLDELLQQLEALKQEVASNPVPAELEAWQRRFLDIRKQYKQIEFLLNYLQPELTVQKINGAPLPKIDPMEEVMPVVLAPEGLQIIDETLFLGTPTEVAPSVLPKVNKLITELRTLQRFQRNLYLSDRQVLEAARRELLTVYTLGLTGFDTPGSVHAMPDALVVFQQLARTISPYLAALPAEHQPLHDRLTAQLTGAIAYLQAHQDFDTFDRLTFLRDHLDPLYGGILDLHLALDIETMYEVSDFPPNINYFARQVFSDSLINLSTYVGGDADPNDADKVALGRYLFFDPILSQDLSRSCASCHQPERAFTDGQVKSIATGRDGTVNRNSPTLINAVYSDRYFHDLRAFELEMQIDHVVFEEDEFNSSYNEIIERLNASEEYRQLFEAAYPRYRRGERPAINTHTLRSAMAAYVASLRSFNSPFDRYARGEAGAELSESAINGYNLFMGKGACATCHFAPTFTGTVPPDYADSESEVLGVPAEAIWEGAVVDPDLGRIDNDVPLDATDIFAFSFKTPTVRNVALTAPYMHNGVYQTLEEVLRFYHVGGGAGIGIELENQTLPFDSLDLTEVELIDLEAFMRSLTDTTGTTAVPQRLPDFPDGSPFAERKIGGEY